MARLKNLVWGAANDFSRGRWWDATAAYCSVSLFGIFSIFILDERVLRFENPSMRWEGFFFIIISSISGERKIKVVDSFSVTCTISNWLHKHRRHVYVHNWHFNNMWPLTNGWSCLRFFCRKMCACNYKRPQDTEEKCVAKNIVKLLIVSWILNGGREMCKVWRQTFKTLSLKCFKGF